MDVITNRPGGATDVGNFPAPTIDMEKHLRGANYNYIDKDTLHSMLELMAGEFTYEKEPAELVESLVGRINEDPMVPPRLAPFPPLTKLLRLDREDRARLLDKRASELMREIEGLRDGHYKAPEYRLKHRMIEQARRRFRRLRDTAMKLGHWTDKRWDKGSEETHLV